MHKNRKFHPTYHYPIDDYPIDINEFIKPYEAGINEIQGDNLCFALAWGLISFRNKTDDVWRTSENPEMFSLSLYQLANTGFDSIHYIPNDSIKEIILKAPEIAITDLDKALLGWINICFESLVINCTPDGKNYRDIMYSYIYFLHNVQKFEQKTRRTFDVSLEMLEKSEANIFKVLTDPSFVEIDSNMISLSDEVVNKLANVISYREELNALVADDRKNQKEYILNERNNSDWELFISCINYRVSEENRVVDLINSDISVVLKLSEFEKYLDEIDVMPVSFNTELSLGELLSRIIERNRFAPNYLWVKAGDEPVQLDNAIISSISSPYSFNCVLIAYHAFLLKMSTDNILRLTFSLHVFIKKNLGYSTVKRNDFEKLNSLEDCLNKTCKMVIDFYEKHEKTIETIKYNTIQNDETLSGLGFYDDIWELVFAKERKMASENINEFMILLNDNEEYKYRLAELIVDNASAQEFRDLVDEFRTQLPNKVDDENKLLEHEVANRLIVSINAIYILVNTMDRLLKQGLIREEYEYSIKDYSMAIIIHRRKHIV